MAQVNNNAESLSRELRKFKNLKSVDFKGLLSGTPESYVNLYRYLFCENNIGFSQLVIEKGYDLSGLNDYKFMEAAYRMMRDFLNMKPPINQNQFFSPGFTQRKLEMSTLIAAEVRRITNDLVNKNGKKTVQTQSLMKVSLKRPNSAPKQTRIIEMGDEIETVKSKNPLEKYSKPKSGNKYAQKNNSDRPQRPLAQHNNSQSSQELSDESDEVDSYNSQTRVQGYSSGNNYDTRPKPFAERLDSIDNYGQPVRNIEFLPKNNYDNRPKPFAETQKYSSGFNSQKPIDSKDMSAFDTSHSDQGFNSRNNNQDRFYDVKQYVPSSHTEPSPLDKEQRLPGLEKIMQQFDTVLARITLLEGRMNRIESKLDNNNSDRYPTSSLYPSQGNANNTDYISSYEHNHGNKSNSYSNKISVPIKVPRDAIPDFESNHQQTRSRVDSDRSYSSSTYSGGNYRAPVDSGTYSGTRYVTNYTNYSDKRPLDLPPSNGSRQEQYPLSSTYNSSDQYHSLSSTYKPAQPLYKTTNGIPPIHPASKKTEDPGYRDPREKVVSQTDRIASMLSETQKMLRLSDEEL